MNKMYELSRRHFIKVTAASLALSQSLEAKIINSRVHGVYIGLQTYSLRGLRYDALIPALKQIGIGECELVAGQIEPLPADVPDLAKWRATVSLDYFTDMRKKFNQAGISIHGYNARFGAQAGRGGRGARGAGVPGGPGAPGAGAGPAEQAPAAPPAAPAAPPPAPAPVTDEEIERTFLIAKTLGAKSINGGVQVAITDRVSKMADKYNMIIGIYTQPEASTLPANFRYDFDIGDYTRAGHDSLQFVTDNFDKITDIHLKDCKLNGPSVPFGTGDSHMKEILQLLKKRKSQIRANIDCDYPGTGTSVEEIKKCFDYIKACLA